MNFTELDPSLILKLKEILSQMDPDSRIAFLDAIFEDYCKLCGREWAMYGRRCPCCRDD